MDFPWQEGFPQTSTGKCAQTIPTGTLGEIAETVLVHNSGPQNLWITTG